MKKTLIALSFFAFVIWQGCTRASFVQEDLDCDMTVTYDDMEPIITLYCSYSGCHDGNTADAQDYRTYSDIAVDFGSMEDRVILQSSNPFIGMPRDDGDGPPDLTEEHYNLFNCWIQQEFPEN